MKEEQKADSDAIFEFGGPSPKIGSWFFPNDPNESPRQVEEGDVDDSAQPS